MPLPTLYTIAADYAHVLHELVADDSLDEQAIADTLEGLRGTLEAKALNVGKFIAHLDALAADIKRTEEQQRARRAFLEKRADRLREYVKFHLLAAGVPRIDHPDPRGPPSRPRTPDRRSTLFTSPARDRITGGWRLAGRRTRR